eukprot:8997902-Pyramimonas_sp.AAC.1
MIAGVVASRADQQLAHSKVSPVSFCGDVGPCVGRAGSVARSIHSVRASLCTKASLVADSQLVAAT